MSCLRGTQAREILLLFILMSVITSTKYFMRTPFEMKQNFKMYITSNKLEDPNISEEDYFGMRIKPDKSKKILLFDGIWNHAPHAHGKDMFHNCRYSNCFITGNRKLYNWSEWDAIMWDNVFSRKLSIPTKRHPETRYVLMNRETPARYGGLKKWPVIFNWTMTYRMDSNIPFRYGYVYKLPNPQLPIQPTNKTGLAAWMCSTFDNASGRKQLRNELEKYMNIDIYGKTGSLKCGTKCRAMWGNKCDSDCRDMIAKKYKFYFSFENSLCKDSLTEKLFTMLTRPIVPVVWSGADVSLLTPPHSTINAFDFETAKDLVDYLKYLDGNDTAYYEYLEWKTNFGVIAGVESVTLSFCHLCASLHENKKTHWYMNLHDWWVKNHCTNPNTPRIRQFLNITEKVKLPYPKSGEHFQFGN